MFRNLYCRFNKKDLSDKFMSQFKIQLNTGNKFWTPKGLGAMGMDPHRAIAELVANSLDWRRKFEDNVDTRIDVTINKNSISIKDNGIGMNAKELVDAMQLSVANDDLRRNLRVRKGMFGMGMKVACLTLGWHIEIITKSINDNSNENVFTLNSRLLDDNDKENVYRKELHGTTRPASNNSPLFNYESGTNITISDLTHKTINPINVRDSLQEIFQPEVGVERVILTIIDGNTNAEYLCKQTIVPVFDESKIVLDDLNLFVEDEDTKESVQITGWIGLLKTTGSGSGEWGLHLFKNNQIIERFHQLPIRLGGLMPKNPHPVYGRLYGEIHLDMCKPAFHKVGFDYSTESWEKVRELLKSHIEVVMNASKDYKKKDFEKAEQSIRSIQQHSRAAKRAISILTNKPSNEKEEELPTGQTEAVKISKGSINQSDPAVTSDPPEEFAKEELPDNAIVLRDGQWFTIVEPIFDNLIETQSNKPWIYHFKKESNELAIVINKGSAIYQDLAIHHLNEREVQLVVNWSISDCILFLLYDKFYYSLNDSSNFRDEQLSKLFLTAV